MITKTTYGIELKDTSEILKEVQNAFLQAFPDISLEPSTPQGQLITTITEYLVESQNSIAEFSNMLTSGGSGNFLDSHIFYMYGIKRKQAAKSSCDVIVKGKAGTPVLKGFKGKSGDYEFETISDYKIDANGEVVVTMQALNWGIPIIEANSLNEIVTITYGIDSISNPTASIEETELESDSALWLRAKNSIRFHAKSLFSATIAQINNLQGVRKIGAFENIDRNDVTYKGILFMPHSINLCIKGGDLQEIGATLLKNKNPGCYVGGNTTIPVYDEVAQTKYTMRCYRPQAVVLKAEIQVQINTLTSLDYVEQLQSQFMTYIENFEIGGIIIPFNISSALSYQNVFIMDIKIAKLDGELSYNPIELTFTEEATIEAENINIVLFNTTPE